MYVLFAVSLLEGRKIPLFLAVFKKTNVTELIYVFPMHLFTKPRWGNLQNRFYKTTRSCENKLCHSLLEPCVQAVCWRQNQSWAQILARELWKHCGDTEQLRIFLLSSRKTGTMPRASASCSPHAISFCELWTQILGRGVGGGAECCTVASPPAAVGCGKGEEKLGCRRIKSSRPICFLSSGCALL